MANWLRAVIPKELRPIGYIEKLVRAKTGSRVAGGPFEGMRYTDDTVGSAYVPKLLGIYERELNGCIERACSLNFPVIVDVGAAEGYYAIGMALRNPEAKVVAFEMEAKGRSLMGQMARENQVSHQVEIRGRCEPEDLAAVLANHDRALVICDVEGYEDILLNPQASPQLGRCHLLVEMHDFIIPNITERISERFAPSHSVGRIWQEPRMRSDLPYRSLGLSLLPGRYLDWAVSEWRPVRMSWLWAVPKSGEGKTSDHHDS
ncbi:MAG TPA: hypothetical protein VD994_05480 [Prosthecobacter sp.]|nr:hypothetical protein [Prosthecobacter sp.]